MLVCGERRSNVSYHVCFLSSLQVRKQGAGLGLNEEHGVTAGAFKKKRRGGERSRRRKFAEAQRSRKEGIQDASTRDEYDEDETVPKLFSFMNRNLGDGSEAAAVLRRAAGSEASAMFKPCTGYKFGVKFERGFRADILDMS